MLNSPENKESEDYRTQFGHLNKSKARLAIKAQQRSDAQDKEILKREAKAINAELTWIRSATALHISLQAPQGFHWRDSQDEFLEQEVTKDGVDFVRQAVAELLTSMSHGFTRVAKRAKARDRHDESCECQECEDHDNEIAELDF